jgi:hypothetical protein
MNKLADNLLCRLQHVIPLHLFVLPSAAQFSGSLLHSRRGAHDFVKENINNPFAMNISLHSSDFFSQKRIKIRQDQKSILI